MHAEALARPATEQRRLHGAGAAPVHALALAVPVEDGLRARVALHHPLGVVVRVVREHFDGDEVARADLDERLEQLAEVAPVHGLVGGGHVIVVHRAGHAAGLRLRGHRADSRRRHPAAREQRAFQEIATPVAVLVRCVVHAESPPHADTAPPRR